MNIDGQNDWQNLGGGSWAQNPGPDPNQPQGYGAAQPQPQPTDYPAANNGVPVQNYQPGAYPPAPAPGSDLSGGGQTFHGAMPPDTSYSGQPYIQPYNQGYNQPYNQQYNQQYNQGYNQPNQYGVPPISSQWRRPLVMGAIAIGVILLLFLLLLRSIFRFGLHGLGVYGYAFPWWVPLIIIGGIALRVVLIFTRANYRSPIATMMSVIGLIFSILVLLIIFL